MSTEVLIVASQNWSHPGLVTYLSAQSSWVSSGWVSSLRDVSSVAQSFLVFGVPQSSGVLTYLSFSVTLKCLMKWRLWVPVISTVSVFVVCLFGGGGVRQVQMFQEYNGHTFSSLFPGTAVLHSKISDPVLSLSLSLRFFSITMQFTRSRTSPRTPLTTGPSATSVARRATTGLWPSRLLSLWVSGI